MTAIWFPTAAEGIAQERDMLAAGQPGVLVWSAMSQAIIVPETLTRREGVMAAMPALAAAGWPVLARSSGGGAVPQGPGTLNLSLVLPLAPGFQIGEGYDLICDILADALLQLAITADTGAIDGAFCDGAWNITVGGRKLAGTAQRWRGGAGTVLLHAAAQVSPLPSVVWPALAALHHAAGLPDAPRPDAHTTLSDLVAETGQLVAFPAILAQTARNRLSELLAAQSDATA